MDDGIDLSDVSRQLEAERLSPTGAAATTPTGIRQSEMRPEDYADERLDVTESAYDPLHEGFIRLVQITQDPTTGDIECWTKQFPLHCHPPYIALSYACGPPPASFGLKLNGIDWHVRKNLSRFLRQRVRMSSASGEWLRIDAICINLENGPERAHQVRLMAKIYGRAFRVLVWLGPAD